MNKKQSYITSLISGSVILSALDKFTIWVYSALANGLFGRIFTSYRPNVIPNLSANSGSAAKIGITESLIESDFMQKTIGGRLRRFISARSESSLLINYVLRFTAYLRGCHLKFYGFMFLSFGMYAGIVFMFKVNVFRSEPPIIDVLLPIGLVAASVPLLFSKHTLASSVLSGKISSFIFVKLLGFRADLIRHEKDPHGRLNVAFIVGMVFGLSTVAVSPLYLVIAALGVIALYLILVSPETGIFFVFLTLPFLPTMALVAAIAFIFICYLLKLIRGKRMLKFEPIDIAVVAFMLMVAFGGIFSVSRASSLKSVMVFICYLLGYFLTANLIRSREWLNRCTFALLTAAVCESAFGIVQYFGGNLETKWLDTKMFADIAGRVTGTLENPNVLAEYIILTLPVMVGFLFSVKGIKGKFAALLMCGVMSACLLLTWSRGAWIGILAGAALFIMIYHRRSIYLFVAAVCSLPLIATILPASIMSRISSIGNMGDSSTSYRVSIWRASMRMASDYFVGGIGVGEGAFRSVYPRYSLSGIEAAPHSHNLYIQIWLEIGVFGIAAFLVFMFLLLQNNFSHCRELSDSGKKGVDRTTACACLCGLCAVLVQGMTDYVWYNYRIFLMFWLMAGLSSAFVRVGRNELEAAKSEHKPTPDSADTAINL